MSEFNIGDKVVSNDSRYLSEEIGTIVGIDTRENASNKYLVKFDSLDISEGWAYGCFRDISLLIIEPFDGYAIWLNDLEKVENESEEEVMSEFNIGDKVISKDVFYSRKEVGIIVGIDTRENAFGKYLVKFDSLSKTGGYGVFVNNPYYNIEPYEGRAIWLDDLEKAEEEYEEEKCEEGEVCMSEFNIGDKVISNDDCYSGKEIGTIVGIDPKAKASGKYLVKFDSIIKGLEYERFCNNPDLIIEPYEGYGMWLDDLEKVEEEYEEEKCEEECEEDKHEEDVRMEFDKIREQKKEVIKTISGKVLEMTLEIKEMEHEIEKIKKEWHL